MNAIRTACTLLVAAFALAARPAIADMAAIPLQLKSEVTVEGRIVRLGDLFDGAVPGAERPVMEAPAPGESYQLNAGWLAQLATALNLPWRPTSSFDQVHLTRASLKIEPGVVRQALAGALAERGLAGEIGIDIDNGMPELAVSLGGDPTIAVENLAFEPGSGRFTATLVAPSLGRPEVTRTVTGRAYMLVDVPVLNHRMSPGDAITEADLGWITMPADRIGATVLVDAEDLLGKTPRRPIRPETPMRLTDLAIAVAVTKGSLVTIALETPSMQLTVQGRAMQNGSIGETIRVMNTMSNRTLEAVVRSSTEVAVLSPTETSAGAVQ
jgi:flagellar basal body P-ring formation protein FlgA